MASLGSSIYFNFLFLWISKEPLENQALATFNKDTDSIKEGFKAPDKDIINNNEVSIYMMDQNADVYLNIGELTGIFTVSAKKKIMMFSGISV